MNERLKERPIPLVVVGLVLLLGTPGVRFGQRSERPLDDIEEVTRLRQDFTRFPSSLDNPSPTRQERTPIVVSPSQEVAWGEQARQSFLQSRPLSSDGNLLLRVDRIGRKIAEVGDRSDLVYSFLVIKGEDLQAFSFPGGTVCLTEALARLYVSDDELAFGLGHELAHIALRHHVSKLRMHEALKQGDPGEAALLEAVRSAFDRDAEMEADKFGALYSMRAGYRYSATYEALERLTAAAQGPRQDSAHPEYAHRVDALRNFRQELQRAFDAFDGGVEALKIGKADESISMLNLFIAAFPNSLAGRVNLGAAYLARVRMRSGTPENLAEILPILPDLDVTLRDFPDHLDLERARDNFQQALRAHPEHAIAQACLGLIQTRLRQLDEARRFLELARSSTPTSPEFLLCLGNVEYLSGNYAAAAAFYREGLALRQGWAHARKNLALSLEKLGDTAQAREIWMALAADTHVSDEARRHLEGTGARPD